MNAVFTMILRNLRTELEHMDKREQDKDRYIQQLESQLKPLLQQKHIDELTGLKPLFTVCKCGWIPKPGSVLTSTEDGDYLCPDCKEVINFDNPQS